MRLKAIRSVVSDDEKLKIRTALGHTDKYKQASTETKHVLADNEYKARYRTIYTVLKEEFKKVEQAFNATSYNQDNPIPIEDNSPILETSEQSGRIPENPQKELPSLYCNFGITSETVERQQREWQASRGANSRTQSLEPLTLRDMSYHGNLGNIYLQSQEGLVMSSPNPNFANPYSQSQRVRSDIPSTQATHQPPTLYGVQGGEPYSPIPQQQGQSMHQQVLSAHPSLTHLQHDQFNPDNSGFDDIDLSSSVQFDENAGASHQSPNLANLELEQSHAKLPPDWGHPNSDPSMTFCRQSFPTNPYSSSKDDFDPFGTHPDEPASQNMPPPQRTRRDNRALSYSSEVPASSAHSPSVTSGIDRLGVASPTPSATDFLRKRPSTFSDTGSGRTNSSRGRISNYLNSIFKDKNPDEPEQVFIESLTEKLRDDDGSSVHAHEMSYLGKLLNKFKIDDDRQTYLRSALTFKSKKVKTKGTPFFETPVMQSDLSSAQDSSEVIQSVEPSSSVPLGFGDFATADKGKRPDDRVPGTEEEGDTARTSRSRSPYRPLSPDSKAHQSRMERGKILGLPTFNKPESPEDQKQLNELYSKAITQVEKHGNKALKGIPATSNKPAQEGAPARLERKFSRFIAHPYI